MLLAGAQRLARPEATIGFHSPSVVGGTDRRMPFAELADALAAVGASPDFINRVEHTDSYDMWRPPEKRLLAEGVLTGVAEPDEYVYCPPFDTEAEARKALERRGPLAALAKLDPRRLGRSSADYMTGPQRGATQVELFAPIIATEAALADDASCHPAVAVATLRAKLLARVIAKIAARFPDRCKRLMDSNRSSILNARAGALRALHGARFPGRETRFGYDRFKSRAACRAVQLAPEQPGAC